MRKPRTGRARVVTQFLLDVPLRGIAHSAWCSVMLRSSELGELAIANQATRDSGTGRHRRRPNYSRAAAQRANRMTGV